MRVDIAVPRELRQRDSPGRRVRLSASYISRDRRAREEPDGYRAAGPLRRVHSAAVAVEPVAIGLGGGSADAATSVSRLAGGIDVAVAGRHDAGETGIANRAAGAGVQGHAVGGLLVDAFDDVDFAVVRPVCADGPAG